MGISSVVAVPNYDALILPPSESTFYLRKDFVGPDGCRLPGFGESKANCGVLNPVFLKGCTKTSRHGSGKIYTKRVKWNCHRASCPVCYESWVYEEAERAAFRIGQLESKLPLQHIAISPEPGSVDSHLPIERQYALARKYAREVGVEGGAMVYHPAREVKEGSVWYFSPHFHTIARAWLYPEKVSALFARTGWVVHSIRVVRPEGSKTLKDKIVDVLAYQLSHAGVILHHHTVRWFGTMSYGKFKAVPYKRPKDLCPECGSALIYVVPVNDETFELFHYGEGESWWRSSSASFLSSSDPLAILDEVRSGFPHLFEVVMKSLPETGFRRAWSSFSG